MRKRKLFSPSSASKKRKGESVSVAENEDKDNDEIEESSDGGSEILPAPPLNNKSKMKPSVSSTSVNPQSYINRNREGGGRDGGRNKRRVRETRVDESSDRRVSVVISQNGLSSDSGEQAATNYHSPNNRANNARSRCTAERNNSNPPSSSICYAFGEEISSANRHACHSYSIPSFEITTKVYRFRVTSRTPSSSVVDSFGNLMDIIVCSLLFDSYHSTCHKSLRCRIKGLITSCLSFIRPLDVIFLLHFPLTTNTSLDDHTDISIGLPDLTICPSREEIRRHDRPVDIRVYRPGETGFVSIMLCLTHKCMFVGELPQWALTQHFSLTFTPPISKLIGGEWRIWNSENPTVIRPVESQYVYADLVNMQNGRQMSFYGVVVEVSRAPYFTSLRPIPGRLAGMNVDVVDPSCVGEFFNGVHPSCVGRVNVLLVSDQISSLPLVTVGDIIRVHRSNLTVNQNIKLDSIYFDSQFSPLISSVCLWRHDDLSLTMGEYVKKHKNDIGFDRINASSPVPPYWKSCKYTKSKTSDGSFVYNQISSPSINWTQFDWDMIKSYARWVGESMMLKIIPKHMYQKRLMEIKDGGAFFDVIVKVVGIVYDSSFVGDGAPVSPEMTHRESTYSSNSSSSTFQPLSQINRTTMMGAAGARPLDVINKMFKLVVVDGSTDDGPYVVGLFNHWSVELLANTVKEGDWIRIRNLSYGGVEEVDTQNAPVCLLSHWDHISPKVKCFLLVGRKCRCIKLSKSSNTVRWEQQKIEELRDGEEMEEMDNDDDYGEYLDVESEGYPT